MTSSSTVDYDINCELLDACKNQQIAKVFSLLKRGANPKTNFLSFIEENNESRLCPLFCALRNRNVAIVKILLQFGAKTSARDTGHFYVDTTYTLFEISIPFFYLCPELVTPFLQNGAKEEIDQIYFNSLKRGTALHMCIKMRDLAVAEQLLLNGAKVNVCNYEREIYEVTQQTEICLAMEHLYSTQYIKFISLLILFGANVNTPRRTDSSFSSSVATPLHLAIITKNVDLVKLFVLAGANINEPYITVSSTSASSSPLVKYSIVSKTTKNSVWDLCGNNVELKNSLYVGWSPEIFKLTPIYMQKAILSFMIIERREQWQVDKAILNHILSYVVSSWRE